MVKMSRNFFNNGTKFMMDFKECIVLHKDQQNVVVEMIEYKQQKSYSINELLVAFDEERLVFKDPNNRFPTVRSNNIPEEDEQLKTKLDVLAPVIQGYFKNINLDKYLKELEVEKGIKVSRASFYNWKKTWERYGDSRFLLNKKSGPNKRRTEEEVLETLKHIMDENLYNGPDIPYLWIYREYKKSIKLVNEMRGVNDPINIRSFQTIWRIIKEKRDIYKQQKAKEGHVAAKLQRDGAKSVAEKPTRPLERVEIDWTPTDLLLVDPHTLKRKKAWLIYAIDVFSGNPLGFYISFDNPDSHAVKQCLLHCFLPKVYLKRLYPDVENEWTAYGIPTEVVIDNAKVNDSYELERVFQIFGISPIYPEVAAGHKKGTVERGQKTFNDIVHTLKGTTFSNIFERKQYDSDGEACITLQAFYYIAHFIFVDIISHNLSHSRIGGTPHQIWESGISEHPNLLALPFSKKDIRITLCGGSERRKIQSKGILLSRGWYQSPELMVLRSRLKQEGNEDSDVVVRFDFTDVRKVFVENPYDFSFIDAGLDPNKRRILRNKVVCKHCLVEVESSTIHDMNYCKCGRVAVDGGKNYLGRTGDVSDYFERSILEKLK
ncbi:DUF7695 domain-containing protein [Cohnella phaseoli]|uniref:Putative transposase n=1 Tax=Cohnella phaseoli TaxID=456490 RepID=A0A3D9KRD1_9BACL|nr:Mu transposase C-terminal domain-containing protein [Cohnella phaseoli]RED89231.1 putative transposase [Cohnella phaseoli]